MTTFVMRGGKVVDKATARALAGRVGGVISDTMGTALRHPSTGKLMDSKSGFRAITRAHGCVEVGNETMRDTRRLDGFDKASRSADIARAIHQLGG